MRMLLAVAFLLATWGALIGIFSGAYPHDLPAWAGTILVLGMMASVPVALVLFNKHPMARLRRSTTDQFIADLAANDRLVREPHEVGRVLAFDDSSCSSRVYLVESIGKGTLMLHGQYLFSYEPSVVEDLEEGEAPEPRTFPTQRFEVLRARGDEDIIEFDRSGAVVEPEEVPEPDVAFYRELAVWPSDGQLIVERTFDALRDRLLRRA